MRRDTQHVLLVILGGALVRLGTGEVYLRYVRPSHRWLLIGAGVVIVALAVAAFVRDLRTPAVPAAGVSGDHRQGDHGQGDHGQGDHGQGDHGQGDHGHGDARYAPWLLLVPVLAVALVAPPALGADAVVRGGAGNTVQAADLMPPLPPGDAPPLTVGEFVRRTVWDPGRSLDDREVTITGFVVRRGAAVDLARMTVVCCAADARPNRVRLVGDLGDAGAAASDTWLQVRGTVQPGSATAATRYVPAMTVRSVRVVAEPVDPYEY